MNSRNKKISIKNPCHLTWNDLEGSGSHKHCKTCATTVVDFSNISNEEIIEFLSTKNKKTCGNITQSQLHSIITTNRKPNYLFKSLFLVFFGLSAPSIAQINSPSAAITQSPMQPSVLSQPQKKLEVRLTKHSIDSEIIIKGIVVGADDNLPLPKVTILIRGKKKNTTTNADGEFELKLDQHLYRNKTIILEVCYLGYKSQELKLKPNDQEHLKIAMEPDASYLGEIVIKRIGLWSRVKSLFKRKNTPRKNRKRKNK